MFEKLLDFWANNSLYVVAGVLFIVLLMLNGKLRKYVGKICTLLFTLLFLYLAYKMVTPGSTSLDESLDNGTTEQKQEKMKSMYYKDPEERMQKK